MPVFFYVDPEMAADWNCRNINNITLSYVFHKVGCGRAIQCH
jgi:cytochrome c oxidase assembly protein subunit 11